MEDKYSNKDDFLYNPYFYDANKDYEKHLEAIAHDKHITIGASIVACVSLIILTIFTFMRQDIPTMYHNCIIETNELTDKDLTNYEVSMLTTKCKKCSQEINNDNIVTLKHNYCETCDTENNPNNICTTCNNTISKYHKESVDINKYRRNDFHYTLIVITACTITMISIFIILKRNFILFKT